MIKYLTMDELSFGITEHEVDVPGLSETTPVVQLHAINSLDAVRLNNGDVGARNGSMDPIRVESIEMVYPETYVMFGWWTGRPKKVWFAIGPQGREALEEIMKKEGGE